MTGLRNLPLSLRVPLLASALMVLVGIVASQQVLAALGEVQEARLRELARLHVEGLSVALGPDVLRDDVWEIYDTLDRAVRATEGRRMLLTVVADDEGRVLAATDPRRVPVDTRLEAVAAGAQTLETLTVDGGISRVRVLAPLVFQERKVGQILTELDVSDLVTQRRKAALLLLLGNALVTGLLAVGGYFVMRRMLRPVAVLAQHMSRMSGQPQPIPEQDIPKGDTELANLFQTYNAMAGSVEAKAEAERRLAERERFVSLGRLSSSLAHEINNPLGGLLNATDTLQCYADRPEVVRQSALLLDRGLKHLRDVVRATLEQNRLDRTGEPLRPEDFDDLRLLFTPEASRQDQALDWQITATEADLAPLPAGPLRQIALNLLLNGSSAAGPGGRIGLAVVAALQGLRVMVRDNGPGMSEVALRRLLTDDPVQPGSGVGLRLVRDLVAALGGHIEHRRAEAVTEIAVVLPVRGLPC